MVLLPALLLLLLLLSHGSLPCDTQCFPFFPLFAGSSYGWMHPLCLNTMHAALQEYQADADEDNAALSRMRNALVNELDEAKKAEGK